MSCGNLKVNLGLNHGSSPKCISHFSVSLILAWFNLVTIVLILFTCPKCSSLLGLLEVIFQSGSFLTINYCVTSVYQNQESGLCFRYRLDQIVAMTEML